MAILRLVLAALFAHWLCRAVGVRHVQVHLLVFAGAWMLGPTLAHEIAAQLGVYASLASFGWVGVALAAAAGVVVVAAGSLKYVRQRSVLDRSMSERFATSLKRRVDRT